MERAVILIGVSRVKGGLQPLQGVEAAIDGMQAWAQAQNIPENRIIRRTDRLGPVTARQIYDDVRSLPPTVEQVIVYFSGHGIVNARQEFWLLSGAPESANEAVNLEGTIALARSGGITHVVFISDACRTAAVGVQIGRITGSDIFPNIVDAELERAVDVFFATSLGSPALEVINGITGEDYNAVYTEALLLALNGEEPTVIPSDGLIRPRSLKKVLPQLVRRGLNKKGLSLLTNQVPDARITSDDDAWISKVNPPSMASMLPDGGRLGSADAYRRNPSSIDLFDVEGTVEVDSGRRSLEETVHAAIHTLVRSPSEGMWLREVLLPADALGRAFVGLVWDGDPRELRRHSTQSWPGPRWPLLVQGGRITKLTPLNGSPELGQRIGGWHEMAGDGNAPIECLAEFENGCGALIPLIPGYRCTLEFHGSQLMDVFFESDNGPRWRNPYDAVIRRVMAEATRRGAFSLDRKGASELVMRLGSMIESDPTAGIYAAYALHERGDIKRVRSLAQNVHDRLGWNQPDLLLLSRNLLRHNEDAQPNLTQAPLLAQGWAFVEALGGPLASVLRELRPYVIDSPWTLYNSKGVALIRHLIGPGVSRTEEAL